MDTPKIDVRIQNVIIWMVNGCSPPDAATELAIIASDARAMQTRLEEAERNEARYLVIKDLNEGSAVEFDMAPDELWCGWDTRIDQEIKERKAKEKENG